MEIEVRESRVPRVCAAKTEFWSSEEEEERKISTILCIQERKGKSVEMKKECFPDVVVLL